MHGHNANFEADPAGYLNGAVVDNISYPRLDPGAGAALAIADGAKHANFDLEFAGMVPERRSIIRIAPVPLAGDAPIDAYWCPFLSGGGLPGFVDVPRQNPARNFVFTAAMQGCALIVTGSPVGAGHFRVYHHQHPQNHHETANINNAIAAVGQPLESMLAYDDYGAAGLGGMQVSNTFNFLHYRNGAWTYVSQGHYFVQTAMTLGVCRRVGLGNNGVLVTAIW